MHTTFKNVFTLLCSSITLLLIYNLVITFTVEKPTTSAKEEKQLEKSDLPEVAVCLEPGYSNVTLEKYGYHISSYYRGVLQPKISKEFVGWNGEENENKSSLEILEEALLLPNNEALAIPKYTENQKDFEQTAVAFRTLGDNIGRCMFISPPTTAVNPYQLWIKYNNSVFDQFNLSFLKMKIYFMDKANSDYLYPNLMDLEGQPISIGLDKSTNRYRTKISRSEHVEGDPHFDCAIYTVQNSFDKCIKKDLEDLLAKKIGCQPPYLSENLNNTCDKKFNVSLNKSKEISALFWHLRYRGIKFKCKAPCTKTSYRTRFAGTAPYAYTALYITFDKTVDVTRSRFSIDGPTFLTKSGGFIGVGRSLLLVLVSLLGAFQVIRNTLSFFAVMPCCAFIN